jgi:hypothetical protein
MALNKAQLTADILKAFEDAKKIKEEPPAAAPILAAQLADAIDAYVRGAVVTGVQVSVDLNLSTSNVNSHAHTVTGTATGTQSVNGTLQ